MTHLLKITNTILIGILADSYTCIEKIPIVLGSKMMSDGSERFNFATIEKVKIKVRFGRLNDIQMQNLLNLLKSNFVFPMEFWSIDDKINKTRNFRLVDIPEPVLINSVNNKEQYNELDVEFETVG